MGVPTTGSELFTPIPNAENAWSDIGPLLLNKNGRGNGPLYHSGIALDLIHGGTAKDLDLMHKYLAINAAKRDAITAILKQKPKMQVPHNYDEGFMMLLPEYATMKGLCKDYCLAAYVAGLEGKTDQMLENYNSANRFAKHCFERSELIGNLVGIAIEKIMVASALRLAEQAPAMQPILRSTFMNPEFYGNSDIKRIICGETLAQIVTCRFLDSPLADRRKYAPPLDQIFKSPTADDYAKAGTIHTDDYIPKSRSMRNYLRRRLEEDKPFLTHLMAQKELQSMPDYEEFRAFFDFSGMPPAYESMGPVSDDSKVIFENLCMDREFAAASRNLWRALDVKAKTGAFPANLDQIGIPIQSLTSSQGYRYQVVQSGVLLESMRESNGHPVISLGYPMSLAMQPKTLAAHREMIQKYRKGLVNEQGSRPAKSPVPPAGTVPAPGAPAVVSPAPSPSP